MTQMKNIGVDLDDVLLDFNGAFIEFHNTNYGTNQKRENVTSFYLEKVWNISIEEIYKRLNDFYHSDHHKNAKPVEGAIEGIRELSKHHTIHIITASPEEMRKEISDWLQTHFQDHIHAIHFVRKTAFDTNIINKKIICQELGIEIFIDDALHNAEDVSSLGIPVLLLDTPWNQGEVKSPIVRVFS